jgi:hypothetical protein
MHTILLDHQKILVTNLFYLDTIFILDEYDWDMYSMKVIYKDINIICSNILKNYKVINSNGTECKMVDLGRLIMSNLSPRFGCREIAVLY